MYNVSNLPTFTYAGAIKPQRSYGDVIRNTILLACLLALVAVNLM